MQDQILIAKQFLSNVIIHKHYFTCAILKKNKIIAIIIHTQTEGPKMN